ncbi:hypothetical protein B0H34DRAFT_859225 [Crassisporium funariophilum]|nr:hypothetical protein B0H34DRAFT_859225 [Crassisporium funariophilum]
MPQASPLSMKGPAEVAHGWMFAGFAVNVLLLGVMITQVYLYYGQYKNDKKWIKIFVAVLFCADCLNTGFDFAYLYRSLITYFGDAAFLEKADWLFATDPVITGLIASSVQLFFAWRVRVLTKTWVYPAVIGSFAIAGGVSSIVCAYEITRTPRFVDFQNFKAVVIVWLAAEALGDVIITALLVWYLVRAQRPFSMLMANGFQRSDMMVDRIIRITVQTGLLTMIVASLDLFFYLYDPTGTHLLFNFPLCKLYSNSLMSSLNSRRGWKYGGTGTGADSEGQIITTGGLNIRTQAISGNATKQADIITFESKTHPEVFVHVEQHELRDVSSPPATHNYDDRKRTLGSNASNKTLEEKWEQERHWGA